MKKPTTFLAAVFAAGVVAMNASAAPIPAGTVSAAAYYEEELEYGDYYGDYYEDYGEQPSDYDYSAPEASDGGEKSFTAQDILTAAFISLLIGAVIALIICLIMKSFMKTANSKYTASDYIRKNSFNITRSRDIFIYSRITKKRRPKEDDRRR